MAQKETDYIPIWFWIIALFALVWNLMGAGSFIGHISMSHESLLALPDTERKLLMSYPTWIEVVYALAAFTGVLASIGLLLRKKWAKLLFIISLIAVTVQMVYSIIAVTSLETFGPEAVILPVFIILAGIFHVFISRYAIKKGWLN
ncbi:hypothetical protein [Galbibacter pacificus]|uniref:Sugar transporter n=1 Tax=Galbibacter pacificus TaxID=2996052 RepID=A0ABT6FVV8_9FLAO|nr:hypothetical protein [Galbibacter pacificus]MDG3583682.1 hypothetical protein [Galbibacter pacificus]MDG3587400.1 hypothetical protein [Galbibacter pacificus]